MKIPSNYDHSRVGAKTMKRSITPNYMNHTVSSAAKKEQLRITIPVPDSKTTTKSSVTRKTGGGCFDVGRATCSSTLKDRKFPAYLELNHGGIQSAVRVCPYTYCSLNACCRRRAPSSKRANLGCRVKVVGDRDMDQFVEDRESVVGGECLDSDGSGTDLKMSDDGAALFLGYRGDLLPEIGLENRGRSGDGFECKSNGYEYRVEDQVLADEALQESNSTGIDSDGKFIKDSVGWESSAPVEVPRDESKSKLQPTYDDNDRAMYGFDPTLEINLVAEVEVLFSDHTESSNEDQTSIIECMDSSVKNTEEDITRAFATSKRKRRSQMGNELENFNPREPNFLKPDPNPEAEKVDLRHHDLDEERNIEEWMVDYALRQAITKLGPGRKRKVALFVEAFEKVMPTTKCELPGSGFDHVMPIQAACR